MLHFHMNDPSIPLGHSRLARSLARSLTLADNAVNGVSIGVVSSATR